MEVREESTHEVPRKATSVRVGQWACMAVFLLSLPCAVMALEGSCSVIFALLIWGAQGALFLVGVGIPLLYAWLVGYPVSGGVKGLLVITVVVWGWLWWLVDGHAHEISRSCIA